MASLIHTLLAAVLGNGRDIGRLRGQISIGLNEVRVGLGESLRISLSKSVREGLRVWVGAGQEAEGKEDDWERELHVD